MTDGILRSVTKLSAAIQAPFPVGVAPAVFLLDAYPTAAIAFSYRKLRDAYAGSAVRIRRSSDNAELDIGFVGEDFDAAAAAAHIGGGSGFIVTWYDQSGNGDNVTMVTAANQPTYTAVSGINSKPCHLNTASDHLVIGGGNANLSGSTTASCFGIATSDWALNLGGARLAVFQGTGNGVDYDTPTSVIFLASEDGGNDQIMTYRNSGFSLGIAMTTDVGYRLSSIYDGANASCRVNNGAASTFASTGNFGTTGAFRVGGNPTSGGHWFGYIGEIVVWASDQTSNATGIDANQSTYWGI